MSGGKRCTEGQAAFQYERYENCYCANFCNIIYINSGLTKLSTELERMILSCLV